LRSVGHELAHMGRYRVGVDDVLERVAPVVRISGFKGALGAKSRLACCGPEREPAISAAFLASLLEASKR
jgi:hypothetical protein